MGSSRVKGELPTALFTYGTLKPGFPNSQYNPPGARYLEAGETVALYPLVVEPSTRVPFLLPTDEDGKQVKGVLFAVTQTALDALDEFEGVHNKFYDRRLIDVRTLSEQIVQAFVYFKHPDSGGPPWARPWTVEKLRTLEWIDEYSMEHSSCFVTRRDRQ